ncbi:MAG: hypothetical protein RL264_578 [Bacteroidota bacterium]|jgi:protein tyrosine/serine phosphatase/predicted nucleotidyltransferase
MKQVALIEKIRNALPKIEGIEIGLLIGSFARKTAIPNSDIDLQLLVANDFKASELIKVLKIELKEEQAIFHEVASRKKVVVYFKELPKIDIGIFHQLHELDRNFLGSEITDISASILFEKEPSKYQIENYLNVISKKEKKSNKKTEEITALIDKFMYEFESCSTMHRRSDGYQFYFFYNIALHCAIQLKHFSEGLTSFNFLPKNFITQVLNKHNQSDFYKLNGTLFLPDVNQKKRSLLDFFYSAIENLVSIERLEEIKEFCEWVFERDFLWNLRDISKNNSRLKSGIIFRTATLSLFQSKLNFHSFLDEKNIKTVIDLRADREIEELPYTAQSLSKFNYVKAQLDPWNQPDWFVENHQHGTDEEIAYRFFGLACNHKIKDVMEAILNENEGASAIHCHAGKDRTGIIISILHLLVDTPLDVVYADYLASEIDTHPRKLKIVLEIIEKKGGVESYLINCGLTENQIEALKTKIINV